MTKLACYTIAIGVFPKCLQSRWIQWKKIIGHQIPKACDKIGTFCNCHCHLETKMLPQHKTQHASVKILLHLERNHCTSHFKAKLNSVSCFTRVNLLSLISFSNLFKADLTSAISAVRSELSLVQLFEQMASSSVSFMFRAFRLRSVDFCLCEGSFLPVKPAAPNVDLCKLLFSEKHVAGDNVSLKPTLERKKS